MASTTYDHFAGYGETVTKRHDFVDANKIVRPDHFAVFVNMVRNAGQLPQPFWLGAACGGGSHSLSASVARA
jgi:hypothetical protein